jgi:hypothetical protein
VDFVDCAANASMVGWGLNYGISEAAERIVGQLVGLRIMRLALLTGRPVGFCKHF